MSAARGHSPVTVPSRGCAGALPVEGAIFAGRYRIEQRIAEASRSAVYEAEDIVAGELVAIKTLPQEPHEREILPGGRVAYSELRRWIQLEGRALEMIDHPGVVALRQHGASDEGAPFLALELLRGEPWSETIEQSGPQPLEAVARVAVEACAALGAVHRAGIVHRDVKTELLVLLDDGCVKLIDFGLARLPNEADVVPSYIAVGTAEYMSPEQWARAAPEVDRRADIFSLGVVLYEALTGQLPFTGTDPQRTARAILWHPPQVPLREARPDLPPPVVELVDAMLEKNPADRPRDCDEVRDVLERFALEPSPRCGAIHPA